LDFVCNGNIYRSAYAEVVARSLGVEAISCGLDAIEDAHAKKSAMRAAKRGGFNLGEHRTRPVMHLTLKRTDLIVSMEPWQAVYLD
jgi:protein-tyrosine phosphatase